MIDRPGLYTDIDVNAYFADPCPAPSLTQSVAKIILDKSPLHAWHAHPKLNPDWKQDSDPKFDIANVAHMLLIGRGRDLVILDYEDWRTKASQEERKIAVAAGKLPILQHQYERAVDMRDSALKQLGACNLGKLFNPAHGAAEVVIAWQEKFGWCRQMLDWVTNDKQTYVDYKTTDWPAAPHAVGRLLAGGGWDVQGAMAEIGMAAVKDVTRLRCLFVVQETAPPYCLTVCELSETHLTMGRKKLAVAMRIWGNCLREDVWPGYPAQIITPDYPGYLESQWLTREETEFADLLGGG